MNVSLAVATFAQRDLQGRCGEAHGLGFTFLAIDRKAGAALKGGSFHTSSLVPA